MPSSATVTFTCHPALKKRINDRARLARKADGGNVSPSGWIRAALKQATEAIFEPQGLVTLAVAIEDDGEEMRENTPAKSPPSQMRRAVKKPKEAKEAAPPPAISPEPAPIPPPTERGGRTSVMHLRCRPDLKGKIVERSRKVRRPNGKKVSPSAWSTAALERAVETPEEPRGFIPAPAPVPKADDE